MIKPYLTDMKMEIKENGKLTMQINFISSKDSEETRTMHTKSHNIEIMMVTKQMKLSKDFLNLFYKIIKNI